MRRSTIGILLLVSFGRAQSPAASEFEVASVKPNTSGNRAGNLRTLPGGRLAGENIPLANIIRLAYNLKTFQLTGEPAWADNDRFDISAKADKTNPAMEEVRSMTQSLLADRFRLKIHRETRELPVYELVLAKNGSRLPAAKEGGCLLPDPNRELPAAGDPPPHICGTAMIERGRLDAFARSMAALANDLSNLLGRAVVDKTGLAGGFDIHLEFAPEEGLADSALPSIFTALEEQLGLKLDSAKGPVEVLVVDHVEKPSAN
jgi:uncharacterized protein (TIGR03435 family)